MRHQLIYTMLFASVMLVSCNSKTTKVIENESDLIEITKAQFQSENMEFGKPELMPFSEEVHFTGTISPSSTGIAYITLPAAGLISKINCTPGQLVNKGQNLFEIGGHIFINMQRDYAESAAKLMQLKSNFTIVKELFDDNIGTQKELILAESSYKSEKAINTSLKIKLAAVGLDVSKIEDGYFYSTYSIKAPIKGYVTSINTTIGQYVEQHLIIAEIVDVNEFQLKMSIFEKEINKLQVGQNVEFYLAGNENETHNAKITVVGKTMNNAKAIYCYAEIEDLKNLKPVNNQFAEGKITVETASFLSLPETAFIKSEDETYVLKLEEETETSYLFDKIKVNSGRKNNGFVELINGPSSNKILVEGAYNIPVD